MWRMMECLDLDMLWTRSSLPAYTEILQIVLYWRGRIHLSRIPPPCLTGPLIQSHSLPPQIHSPTRTLVVQDQRARLLLIPESMNETIHCLDVSCVVCTTPTNMRILFRNVNHIWYELLERFGYARSDQDIEQWDELKAINAVPSHLKSGEHEPRNGILLCPNHHSAFDKFLFYIRWVPQVRQHNVSHVLRSLTRSVCQVQRFVFINHSEHPNLEQWHGRALRLPPDHQYTPLYVLFVVQENLVRSNHFNSDRRIALPFRSVTDGSIIPWTGNNDDVEDDDNDNGAGTPNGHRGWG